MQFAAACSFIGMAVALYTYRHGSLFAYSHGTIDSILLVLFLALLAWLLSGRRSSLSSANGHEDTRKSFAFRLGKTLQRTFWNRARSR